jgi:DNA-binding response OmpR family regulator
MPRILVVEDDPTIAAVLVEALEEEGYAVTAAVDGEAVWLAALERPAAILLDVRMAQMDGLAVARRLRADPRTATIPVALLSARADLAELAAELGAEAIAKPFDLDAVLDRVKALAGAPADA